MGAGLRPLTTTAIVDAAIEHVRDDPVLYYGIVAPVSLPLAALGLYFSQLVGDYRGDPEGYGPRVAVSAILLTTLIHLRFVAHGALAWALERRLRGVEATVAGAWVAAAKRSLTLGLGGVVFWGSVLFAATFFVAPAIVAFALFALVPAIAMAEGLSPFRTLRRAIELGWLEIGRSTTIASILFLGTLVLAATLGLGSQSLLGLVRMIFYADTTYLSAVLAWSNPTFAFGAILFGLALLEPVKTLAFVLLYVDRRVRTEGFDLRRKVQLIVDRGKQETESAAEAAVPQEVAP
jgi:hypothetical protein